nr:MAG TPA: hypothetical protein [Caudoviricetes sp.]
MSKFNLAKALAGELVRLRDGTKARIFYRIPDGYVFENGTPTAYPLKGIILSNTNMIISTDECWRDDGTYGAHNSSKDIVCMVDSLADIVNTAYENQLSVKLRDGSKAIILSKIPDKYTYHDGSRPDYVYRGAVLYTNNDNPDLITEVVSWRINGQMLFDEKHPQDIISIWED